MAQNGGTKLNLNPEPQNTESNKKNGQTDEKSEPASAGTGEKPDPTSATISEKSEPTSTATHEKSEPTPTATSEKSEPTSTATGDRSELTSVATDEKSKSMSAVTSQKSKSVTIATMTDEPEKQKRYVCTIGGITRLLEIILGIIIIFVISYCCTFYLKEYEEIMTPLFMAMSRETYFFLASLMSAIGNVHIVLAATCSPTSVEVMNASIYFFIFDVIAFLMMIISSLLLAQLYAGKEMPSENSGLPVKRGTVVIGIVLGLLHLGGAICDLVLFLQTRSPDSKSPEDPPRNLSLRSESAPTTSWREGTPRTSLNKETPRSSLKEETPRTSLKEETPNSNLKEETQNSNLKEETPRSSLKEGTPNSSLKEETQEK